MMPKGVAAKECADRRTLLRPVGADMKTKNNKKDSEKICEAGKTSDGRNIRVVFTLFLLFIICLFVCLSVLFVCQMTNMANVRFDKNQLTQTDRYVRYEWIRILCLVKL